MAYENIQFRKPNMAIDDGYFYNMDHDWDALVARTDDGSVAFTYPLQTLMSAEVKSLEYDGVNFWTMNNITGGTSIKRWQISNETLILKETFDFSPNFSSEAFTVEHYHTSLTTSGISGNTIINVGRYYDTTIVSGTKLTIGPNDSDQSEEAYVTAVSGIDITLTSGIQCDYDIGDAVNFYNNLWIFNSDSTGSLHKIDAITGSGIAIYNDSEYDDITAATFARLAIGTVGTRDALIYPKSTNLKFVNIDTLANYEVMVMDNEEVDTTLIPIYDLAIAGTNIYRLQLKGTYWETTYSWSLYQYVISTSRSFLDSIVVAATPVIIPANGYNYITIQATVKDQYNEGVIYKPVYFTDDDPNGFLTINPSYTDVFFGTGVAETYYRAGLTVRTVNIEGTATQND